MNHFQCHSIVRNIINHQTLSPIEVPCKVCVMTPIVQNKDGRKFKTSPYKDWHSSFAWSWVGVDVELSPFLPLLPLGWRKTRIWLRLTLLSQVISYSPMAPPNLSEFLKANLSQKMWRMTTIRFSLTSWVKCPPLHKWHTTWTSYWFGIKTTFTNHFLLHIDIFLNALGAYVEPCNSTYKNKTKTPKITKHKPTILTNIIKLKRKRKKSKEKWVNYWTTNFPNVKLANSAATMPKTW